MGLESGTGIGDLVPTNPLSTDAVSAGDDHIRLIKTVMQSITFLKSVQTFTATGTWTRPTNVKRVLIYCLGGGGGGNGGTAGSYAGGSGASGAVALKYLNVASITSAQIIIGAGGAGGAAAGGLGIYGDPTAFYDGTTYHCYAAPGAAGVGSPLAGGIPSARSASIGDIIFDGEYGEMGRTVPGAQCFGARGGGAGGYSDTAALANSGGGGGGGQNGPSTGSAGKAGGSGFCIVFEFGW